MRDPHVLSLYYTVSSHESISYNTPKPVHFTNNIGEFNLTAGHLEVKPIEHFADEASVRTVIEPFLKSWEMEADLTSYLGMIRFQFVRSEIIDRDPPKPGEPINVHLRGTGGMVIGGSAIIHIGLSKYPNPPTKFTTGPTVELTYRRWCRFKEGKESLQSVSYFILTVIEDVAGGREQAANTFSIEKNVLGKIGKLSSTRGDANTARKAEATLVDLTPAEKQWLEEATRRLVYRIGEHASGGSFNSLKFDDLPKI